MLATTQGAKYCVIVRSNPYPLLYFFKIYFCEWAAQWRSCGRNGEQPPLPQHHHHHGSLEPNTRGLQLCWTLVFSVLMNEACYFLAEVRPARFYRSLHSRCTLQTRLNRFLPENRWLRWGGKGPEGRELSSCIGLSKRFFSNFLLIGTRTHTYTQKKTHTYTQKYTSIDSALLVERHQYTYIYWLSRMLKNWRMCVCVVIQ